MTVTVTRRQVARFAAEKIALGDTVLLFPQLAEWLISTKAVRTTSLLVADIEKFLAQDHGLVYAQVTTAQPLDKALKNEIVQLLQESTRTKVSINSAIDESIIGGVVVRTSERELDASIARNIKKLRALT